MAVRSFLATFGRRSHSLILSSFFSPSIGKILSYMFFREWIPGIIEDEAWKIAQSMKACCAIVRT